MNLSDEDDLVTFGCLRCNLPLTSSLRASDNVKSQVRHLFKLPKPGPVYFGAVKASPQHMSWGQWTADAAATNSRSDLSRGTQSWDGGLTFQVLEGEDQFVLISKHFGFTDSFTGVLILVIICSCAETKPLFCMPSGAVFILMFPVMRILYQTHTPCSTRYRCDWSCFNNVI